MRMLFRADGNKELGLGHIVRCLALADALKGEITFLTKDEEAKKLIGNRYKVIQVIDDEIRQIRDLVDGNALLITDFLDTDNYYISEIKKLGIKIISIDNNTKLKRLDADIVINANVFGEEGSGKYYLGPKYMILRKGFEGTHINNEVKSVLVIFGGTDPNDFTPRVVNALRGINVKILLPKFSNIIEIMKSADVAITAAGITLYELAALGVPSIVIPQVEHQEDIARAFPCINIGKFPSDKLIREALKILMIYRPLREMFSRNGKKLVDGKGTQRVVKLINEI